MFIGLIDRTREDRFRAFLNLFKSTIKLEWTILGSIPHSLTITKRHDGLAWTNDCGDVHGHGLLTVLSDVDVSVHMSVNAR